VHRRQLLHHLAQGPGARPTGPPTGSTDT
jgi:hypothetical protein